METTPHSSITFSCDDTPGIIHGITGVFSTWAVNILDSQTHTEQGMFFARYEWERTESDQEIVRSIQWVLGQLGRTLHSLHYSDGSRLRVALLSSKEQHCLNSVLSESEWDNLGIECVCIVSHLSASQKIAARYDIPFYQIPDEWDRKKREYAIKDVLKKYEIDIIGLARYMKILSPDFIESSSVPIVNVHHALLPAFKWANPYGEAYERGVKSIGATAHFATSDLDEWPIIVQRWWPTDHTYTEKRMIQEGRTNESLAFATALRKLAENRVIPYGKRVIVF